MRLYTRCGRQQMSKHATTSTEIDVVSSGQQSASETNTITPSLGHSSSPPNLGNGSPQTPSPIKSYERLVCNAAGLTTSTWLPSRSKTCGHGQIATIPTAATPQQNEGQKPAVALTVFHETATRSRAARRPVGPDLGLPAQEGPGFAQPPAVVTINSRCHARRRAACSTAVACNPPKLRRDTECTDAIVRLIVAFSTKLVHAIWAQSAATPRSSGAFNGAGVLPLQVFIQETLRRSKTSYSTLQVALFYLVLLKPYVHAAYSSTEPSQGCRALQCGRRMFLTALILASKYLQDRNYSSRAWSKISGLPTAEINENERRYLGLISFNLHLTKDVFDNWSRIVLCLSRVGDVNTSPEGHRLTSRCTADDGADLDKPGSDRWWAQQLRHLDPELVRDGKRTEEYIESLTTLRSGADVTSEQLTASMDTPPSSPDNTVEAVTENNLLKLLAESSLKHFGSSTASEASSSPASVGSVPTRPYPANLPTPQTTPRHHLASPMARGASRSGFRCKASSQALLSLDRHAVTGANLETCPPPKPRPCDRIRSVFGAARRDTSTLAPSLSSSPESTTSEVSSGTTRSRSSSISSSSSQWWPSGMSQADKFRSCPPIDEHSSTAHVDESTVRAPGAYSFYHTTSPARSVFEDEACVVTSGVAGSRATSQTASKHLVDEGYSSDMYSSQCSDASTADRGVVEPPTTLNPPPCATAVRSQCPAASSKSDSESPESFRMCGSLHVRRPHKRERSATSDHLLQTNTRTLLWSEQPSVEVLDGYTTTSVYADSVEKQLQHAEKDWACPRRPVCNSLHTKRMALQPPMHRQTSAPVYATNYLCEQAMVG